MGAQALRGQADAHQRRLEVALDIVRQRLERRDVQHAAAPLGILGRGLRRQLVQAPQKRGQRFARAGWRQDQRVLGLGDCRPALVLGGGWRGKGAFKPRPRGWAKSIQNPHHGARIS